MTADGGLAELSVYLPEWKNADPPDPALILEIGFFEFTDTVEINGVGRVLALDGD